MDSHKFTDDEVAEFKDAFELFDKTGTGIIPYSECANLARCFGYDPLESTVRQLLGGGEETPASKEDMENKSISFEDYLPILWGIANSPAPGNLEDFLECLKVFHSRRHKITHFRLSTRTATVSSQLPISDE